jgi:ABC-type Fe3+/spermidine/putrescine transport system ATPase subunit
LYQRPATRWLAGFVGDANFVSGHAHHNTVQTAFGELALHRPAEGPVEVVIRPEDLEIEPADSVPSMGLLATVELVEYLGHGTAYLVRQTQAGQTQAGQTQAGQSQAGQSLEGQLRVRRPSLPILERCELARLRYIGGPVVAFPLS